MTVIHRRCSGNHERDFPNSGSLYNGTDSGGECGVPAETMYYVPTEKRDNYWYYITLLSSSMAALQGMHPW